MIYTYHELREDSDTSSRVPSKQQKEVPYSSQKGRGTIKPEKEEEMKFQAEVIEVKSKKTASLDVMYRIVLQTNDPSILSLGALDADTIVDVEIIPNG